MDKQQQIADALAAKARELAYGGKLHETDVTHINTLAGSLAAKFVMSHPTPTPAPILSGNLTARAAIELADHEAIVLESYLDSVDVWTWGIGVTSNSGHDVMRYKDNPQSVEHALAVYIWLLRNRYIPDVLAAFKGRALTEAQFAAALSFHYNTGAIKRTDWVSMWLAGEGKKARGFLETHYLNGGTLKERRMKEAALFFDGRWTSDGLINVLPVVKPSYKPSWRGVKLVDVRPLMDAALAA